MCGVVAVMSPYSVNQIIFDALTMLQHRGQDAAGILTASKNNFFLRKSKGLVTEAIRSQHMRELIGNLGIGHVRYPTSGSNSELECQPFYVNYPYGIALAHNGNLVNTDVIRKELLEQDYRHINTQSDSELLLNVLATELSKNKCSIENFSHHIFFDAMKNLYKRCIGGYAVVGLIAGVGLFAFRDKNGIRPLVIGRKKINNYFEYMVASETVALDCGGYDFVDDVGAGEAIFINIRGELKRSFCAEKRKLTPCIFEYVYLARPDSVIDGGSVYAARLEMGKLVAKKILKNITKHDIDVVIPVPDSGRHAALSLAQYLKVVYREGLVKNRYVGRTFIMPNQVERKASIRKKLNTINNEFIDKHVLLVDDSIVRGNTSKLIVEMARRAGAKKVSMVSTAPVIKFPNIYGIDMPTHEELIGANRSIEEIKSIIGLDYLFYQELEDLIKAVKRIASHLQDFDTSIFNGIYVTGKINQFHFDKIKNRRAIEKKDIIVKQINSGVNELI